MLEGGVRRVDDARNMGAGSVVRTARAGPQNPARTSLVARTLLGESKPWLNENRDRGYGVPPSSLMPEFIS